VILNIFRRQTLGCLMMMMMMVVVVVIVGMTDNETIDDQD